MALLPGMADAPPASSKLGGQPDLPPSFGWPSDAAGRPLDSLLQINFAEVQKAASAPELPANGVVVFFYELETKPWGVLPEHFASAQASYFVAGENLVSTPPPAPSTALQHCSITFRPMRT